MTNKPDNSGTLSTGTSSTAGTPSTAATNKPAVDKLAKVCEDFANGKATREDVEKELDTMNVIGTEGQTDHQARMQRLLEVMGPDAYNEFINTA